LTQSSKSRSHEEFKTYKFASEHPVTEDGIITKIFGFPENLMIDVKNQSPKFDKVLITEDTITTGSEEVFENIIDCTNVNNIEAVTITEELFETDPDYPNSKIGEDIEDVSIKEEFEIVEESFEDLPVEVSEKTIMDSIDNFDQEGEWKKQIKSCYVKLVDIEFSQILKKKEQRKKHESIPTGVKPYTCSYCSKVFSLKQQVKVHEGTHTGEKTYSCKTCNKCFSNQGSMKRHESIHSGEKPYSCNTCNQCFSHPSYLKKHKGIHTGKKPFSCGYCSKPFRLKIYLDAHERIHTGEKPYSCRYCSKIFSQIGRKNDHERIHTGEKPYSCLKISGCKR
jgi:uncharacterized Zn-finger protein